MRFEHDKCPECGTDPEYIDEFPTMHNVQQWYAVVGYYTGSHETYCDQFQADTPDAALAQAVAKIGQDSAPVWVAVLPTNGPLRTAAEYLDCNDCDKALGIEHEDEG